MSHNMYCYAVNNPINMDDSKCNWPNWVKKVVAAAAIVAVVATVAVISTAVAGPGTAIAYVATTAAKGAASGMIIGAGIGAVRGAINHRKATGSWKGAGKSALDEMGNEALIGATTGAITGAVSSSIDVVKASKLWDSSSKGGPLKNMSDHYENHVLKEGKKYKTKNIITYTNDAKSLWLSNSGKRRIMSSTSIRVDTKYSGGFFSETGVIRSFFYK